MNEDDIELIELLHDALDPNTDQFALQFLLHVRDERLKRLIKQVWQRLPFCDRVVLWELMLDMSDGDSGEPESTLASARAIDPSAPWSGNVAQIAENTYWSVSLHRAKDIKSDAACMYVIAHEFAHVVLRHTQISLAAGYLLGFEPPIYTETDLDTLTQWHEEEADLQAWVWGFQDELKAFLEECPEARRSRWYVEITHY
ncbi:MAG: hypothetical protein ISS52_02580 [Dehalococcoidia bacterium]|nr:hypothetical protein [Dehalococcoidia bacterium]